VGRDLTHRAVLLPTNDHWAVAVARFKDILSKQFIPCVADRTVVELLLDKRRFYLWAAKRGYPVPQTWTVDELSNLPNEVFPIAAKPNCRRTSSNSALNELKRQHFDRLRLSVLRTQAELRKFLATRADTPHQFTFQEYVTGLSDCMYTVGVYVNRQHEVQGMFTGRKVRGFPPDFGDCMVGEVRAGMLSLFAPLGTVLGLTKWRHFRPPIGCATSKRKVDSEWALTASRSIFPFAAVARPQFKSSKDTPDWQSP